MSTTGLSSAFDAALQPGAVSAERDGVTVHADVVDADRLGASVRRLRVGGGDGDIPRQAAAIPEAARGALPERVVPVEVDAGLRGTILRSAPEDMRGREFYEIRSDGAEVTVERYRASADGRDSVPFTLTRDQLGRLIDGLGEAMR